MAVKVILGQSKGDRETDLEGEWHHSMGLGPGLEEKKK